MVDGRSQPSSKKKLPLTPLIYLLPELLTQLVDLGTARPRDTIYRALLGQSLYMGGQPLVTDHAPAVWGGEKDLEEAEAFRSSREHMNDKPICKDIVGFALINNIGVAGLQYDFLKNIYDYEQKSLNVFHVDKKSEEKNHRIYIFVLDLSLLESFQFPLTVYYFTPNAGKILSKDSFTTITLQGLLRFGAITLYVTPLQRKFLSNYGYDKSPQGEDLSIEGAPSHCPCAKREGVVINAVGNEKKTCFDHSFLDQKANHEVAFGSICRSDNLLRCGSYPSVKTSEEILDASYKSLLINLSCRRITASEGKDGENCKNTAKFPLAHLTIEDRLAHMAPFL